MAKRLVDNDESLAFMYQRLILSEWLIHISLGRARIYSSSRSLLPTWSCFLASEAPFIILTCKLIAIGTRFAKAVEVAFP
jgi:hypothetical protein